MHTTCLASILSSLPGWPRARPDPGSAVNVIREAVAQGTPGRAQRPPPAPHLPCPTCRTGWYDIEGIARFALGLDAWPAPPEAESTIRVPSGPQPPARPTVAMVVCGGVEQEEMDWSTFQRGGSGEWQGEWQCTTDWCGGAHTAPAVPEGVPELWLRRAAPDAVLPMCNCGAMALRPAILHDPDAAGDDAWSHSWLCLTCGPWDSVTFGHPAHAAALELAASTLDDGAWSAACSRSQPAAFWQHIQESAAAGLRALRNLGPRGTYFAALPPVRFVEDTNSRIYVPILLDAGEML